MILTLLDRTLAALAGLLTVALLGVVTAGIVSRGLNAPFAWTDELSGFLMVWLACCGWMMATRRNAHIRIRILQDRLPQPAWRATEAAIQAAMVVLGAVVAWKSLHLIDVNSDVEAVTLPLATAWLYVPLAPAGLLTALHGLSELARPYRPEDANEKIVT
jgi:TRAP-type C4-dicarboxylate transport system permease small subunit